MTFRHLLKQILQPLPGFAGMFQRRQQLREHARTIESLRAHAAEQDSEVAVLRLRSAEQDGEIASQRACAAEQERVLASLRAQTEEQSGEIASLRDQLAAIRAEAAAREAERAAAKRLQWKDVPHLEKQGLFVFGQTRSGTTVLTRALNTCPDIMLLSEANLYVEGTRTGFARWFNDMHRQLGGTDTKGTYCPIAPDQDSNGPETMQWLSRRFRYIGDKIAFRGEKLGYNPDECFAFHARHFFSSHYVCVVRNPADVMKSNKEMFQPQDLWLYADSYLQAMLLILAFAETLPNVHVLFHESINQRTFDVIGERLGVDLSGIYEANYHKPYQTVGSRGTDHTGLPWLTILGTAHQMMRDAFSLETLREIPNHPTWMMLAPWIREMREKLLTMEHLRVISPLNDSATPLAQ